MTQNVLNDLLLKKLFSTDEKIVLQAIDEIKNNGNSKYIPSLIELLFQQKNEEIIDQLVKLLSEVKHPDAVDEFIKAIINPRYHNLLEIIISCCWQNGLDFSQHLIVFSDLLTDKDYMIAFEAYTVIQNTEEKISKVDSEHIQTKLKSHQDITNDRKVLINDIINYLPSITQE